MFFKVSSLLMILAAMVSPSLASESPDEVQESSDLWLNNDRYHVFNENVGSFFESWQHCLSLGLQMATVRSAEDDILLALALRGASGKSIGRWWIAGTDLGKTKNFVWITTGKPVGHGTGFTKWAPGEPNNTRGREHCIEVQEGQELWNDQACDARRSTICEKRT